MYHIYHLLATDEIPSDNTSILSICNASMPFKRHQLTPELALKNQGEIEENHGYHNKILCRFCFPCMHLPEFKNKRLLVVLEMNAGGHENFNPRKIKVGQKIVLTTDLFSYFERPNGDGLADCLNICEVHPPGSEGEIVAVDEFENGFKARFGKDTLFLSDEWFSS